MLLSEGYGLIYEKNRNMITIVLPQTSKTFTNTISPVVNRRTDVEEKDLLVLLNVAKLIFCKAERSKDEHTER